ncbi:MAG TPA: ABC transporter ATP-binding protein [Azospirillum sp.]|nr:ABC transporter ATP-binding protein [Azospirillum sp.]
MRILGRSMVTETGLSTSVVSRALPRPLLDVSGVTLQYKTRQHLVTATYRVDFQVFEAERFVLLGPSGCGKSSLLKAVGGFLEPVEGIIRLNGQAVKGPGPERMMVFQEFDQLPPWKTVKQNVMFPLLASGKLCRREAEEKALDCIAKVNLAKFADAYPHMLSGGMKQRVAIARAMAMEPDILLMDEPFAALDALTRRKMQEELLQLWDDVRFTVLFVTHSIEEALIVGTRILVLSPHPGQAKAEINCHGYDHLAVGSPEFQDCATRIHTMLFADRVEDEGVVSPGARHG